MPLDLGPQDATFSGMSIDIIAHSRISAIGQADWDACACPVEGRPDDPFTTYRFLAALEDSRSTGTGSGCNRAI